MSKLINSIALSIFPVSLFVFLITVLVNVPIVGI